MTQSVGFNRLMMEMRAMQMDAMAKTKPAAEPIVQEAGAPSAPSFSELLTKAVDTVADVQNKSTDIATAFEMGTKGVDLTDVMVASQKASVSFQAITQVRNKLVQAYQDIMQMTV